jgi:hypothetical protein
LANARALRVKGNRRYPSAFVDHGGNPLHGIEHIQPTSRGSLAGVDKNGVRLRGRLARLVLFAGMFLTLAAWTAAAAHGVTFTGPTNFGVGDSPQAVAAADFNGDSDPDLAVVNEFSHNVSVLLGGAGGSFTGPTDFAVGNRP